MMSIEERRAYLDKKAMITRFGEFPHSTEFERYKVWKGRPLVIQAVDHNGMCYMIGTDIYGRQKTVFAELWRLSIGSLLEMGAEEL